MANATNKYWYNDGGTWRQADGLWYNDGGTWLRIKQLWYNDGGTWRRTFITASCTITAAISGTFTGFSNATYGSQVANANAFFNLSQAFDDSASGKFTIFRNGAGQVQSGLQVASVNGVTLLGSAATFTAFGGGAQWVWPAVGLVNGNTYDIRIAI